MCQFCVLPVHSSTESIQLMYYLCTPVLSQFFVCNIESVLCTSSAQQYHWVSSVCVLAAVHNTVLGQSGLCTTCAEQFSLCVLPVYNDSTVLSQLCILLSVFGAGGAGGADERGAQRECCTRHGQTLLLPARPLPQLLQTVHRRRWAHHHQVVSCWVMDEKKCYKISQPLLFMLILTTHGNLSLTHRLKKLHFK